jgi:type II secretory ATPase GspE/PulE/Tfp pilus assembly ATPase PilB-like protein
MLLQATIDALPGEGPKRVVAAVDAILDAAATASASDVHFEPNADALAVRFRIDGVITPMAKLPKAIAANVIARLKVLAELLTYRLDIPQEGGARHAGRELRISTFPTIHGEKAVVRFFANGVTQPLAQLGFDSTLLEALKSLLVERTGAIFVTGPSGSGKTTTIYGCLEAIRDTQPGRQIVTVEDPVERAIVGIVQSQVRPGGEFDFACGLRSLLRQDPEVIAIGEIRDRDTAEIASQAALTGHLVMSTLHAGSAAGVVSRLLEMGVEPYLLTSGVIGILNQRLLRRTCTECRGTGCDACHYTGHRGRFPLAELLIPDAAFRTQVLARADTSALAAVAPMIGSLATAARKAIAEGLTTSHEVRRVLGSTSR